MIFTAQDFIKFDVTCRFCGTVVGSRGMLKSEWEGKSPTLEDMGFADTRCDDCNNTFGSYPEMSKRAEEKGIAHDEFKTLIKKAGFKKEKFDELLVKEEKKLKK